MQSTGYHRVVHLHHHKDYPQPVALTDLLIERRLYRELENEAPSHRPMLERLAAHHADLNLTSRLSRSAKADNEIARRLRLQEFSPTAELRRIARDSSGTIIYFGFFVLSWSSRWVGFQSRSERCKHRASLGEPWQAIILSQFLLVRRRLLAERVAGTALSFFRLAKGPGGNSRPQGGDFTPQTNSAAAPRLASRASPRRRTFV